MTEMQVMITYADLHYNLKYSRSGWIWVPYLYMALLLCMLTNYVHLRETVPEGVYRTALAQDRV